MKRGNFGDHKSVGDGVSEMRIDEGPGYRLYYVERGNIRIVLLCGRRQKQPGSGHHSGQEIGEGGLTMAVDLRAFDPAEYLDDAESLAAYLEDALEDGDPGEFLEALGVVARAKGMTELAKSAGVARPALYRSLQLTGHPEFATVLKVFNILGVSFHMTPAKTGVKGAS